MGAGRVWYARVLHVVVVSSGGGNGGGGLK